MKLVKVLSAVVKAPKAFGNWISDSLESWTEMAPYNISNMSQGFSSNTVIGIGGVKPDPSKTAVKPSPYSDFRRREMLTWHFLAMDRAMFGRFSSSAGLKWIRLGEFYMENGDPANALRYGPKGLAIVEADREPDPNDKILFMARRKVADFYLKMFREEEAATLLRKLIDDLLVVDDSEDELITAMKQYYDCLIKLERHEEAIEILLKLVNHLEVSGVPEDEFSLIAYKALSDSYLAIGKERESKLFGDIAEHLDWLRIMEKSGGLESRTLLKELEVLERSYRGLEKLELAAVISERISIIHIASKVKGPDYPGIEADLDRLATYYEKRDRGGDGTVAFHIRKRIKKIKDEKLGRS